MSLTKDKLERFVKQGKAYEKLIQSTSSKNKSNYILLNQLKETKKLLKKIK